MTAVQGLEWIAAAAGAVMTLAAFVRWVYRPLRRILGATSRLLTKIDDATTGMGEINATLLELSGGVTHFAVAVGSEIQTLAEQLDAIGHVLVETISDVGHLRTELKELQRAS